MSLIEEIKNCFCKNEIPVEPAYRAVLFGDSAGYFENVKSIVSYGECEIILALSKGCLKITGEKLYIKKYCLGDVAICGKIKGLERI